MQDIADLNIQVELMTNYIHNLEPGIRANFNPRLYEDEHANINDYTPLFWNDNRCLDLQKKKGTLARPQRAADCDNLIVPDDISIAFCIRSPKCLSIVIGAAIVDSPMTSTALAKCASMSFVSSANFSGSESAKFFCSVGSTFKLCKNVWPDFGFC